MKPIQNFFLLTVVTFAHFTHIQSMQQITKWQDLEPFAGQVIAYHTNAYDPSGYSGESDNQFRFKFTYISTQPHSYMAEDLPHVPLVVGYDMQKLLGITEKPLLYTITKHWLNTVPYYGVRNITPEEKRMILFALKNKKAFFPAGRLDYWTQQPLEANDTPINIILSLIDLE